MELTPINDVVVEPVPIPLSEDDLRPVLGEELFPELFFNLFICAKKKQGKTTAIAAIFKHCISKDTKVFIAASTVDRDALWRQIVEDLRERFIPVVTSTDMEDIMDSVQDELARVPEDEANKELVEGLSFPEHIAEENRKRKRFTPRVPDILYLMDDEGQSMRNAYMREAFKRHRHIKACFIASSQESKDLHPTQWKNLDYLILFRKIPHEDLKIMHGKLAMDVPLSLFCELYRVATAKTETEKHSFLYHDTNTGEFRRNFNMRFTLPEIPQ